MVSGGGVFPVTKATPCPSHPPPAEVTQEVASRGMGLVYDMSAEEGRGELVEMLVGTLMEGRK